MTKTDPSPALVHHPPSDDALLVARARGGDYAAFEAMVQRYEGRIFTLGMRMTRRKEDAEEITQATFLSLMEHLDSFRGEAKFSTWLTSIAVNHALTLLRKRKKDPLPHGDPLDREDSDYDTISHPNLIAPWQNDPEVLVRNAEVRVLIQKALGTLDEKHRSVFVLRDMEDLSTAQTAQELGISEENVKVRLLRARLKLREILTVALADPSNSKHKVHSHEM